MGYLMDLFMNNISFDNYKNECLQIPFVRMRTDLMIEPLMILKFKRVTSSLTQFKFFVTYIVKCM